MKRDWLSLLMLAAIIGVAAWQYPMLPDRIPTHFGISGQADAWMSKSSGVLVMPIAGIVTYLLFEFFAWVGRCRSEGGTAEVDDLSLDDTTMRILLNIRVIMLFMFFLLQGAMFLYAYGRTGFIEPAVGVSVGLLFIYTGWGARRVKRNGIFGMRLPWSLADDENWRKTNDFGGKVFIVLGVLCMVSIAYPRVLLPLILGGVIVASIVVSIYSYTIRRLRVEG